MNQSPRWAEPRNQRGTHSSATTATAVLRTDDIVFGAKPDPRLFSDIAEQKAKEIAEEGGKEVNKSAQLRRFYDELVMWQEKVGDSDERFDQLAPYIYMLKAKVAYAKGRGHVGGKFEAMLRRVIDQAINANTLRQAKLFMEAFMAFYKVHNK